MEGLGDSLFFGGWSQAGTQTRQVRPFCGQVRNCAATGRARLGCSSRSQALYAGGRVCRHTFFLSRAYQYDSICFRISEGIYERSHFFSRQICSSAFSAKWTVHALRLNFHRPMIHNFFPDIRAVAFDFSMLAMTFKHLRHQWCWWFSDSLIRENLSLDK